MEEKSKKQHRPVKVVITDIDVPFISMVSIMVKWAIASVPAGIILFLIFIATIRVLGNIGEFLQ